MTASCAVGSRLAIAALLLGSVCGARAGTLSLGAAYDYSSGTYGGAKSIDETYIPFTAAYRWQKLEVSVVLPYVSVTGPATIIDSTGEFAPGPGGTHSGLGDIILGATLYDLVRSEAAQFYLDLTGAIKFGTADAAQGLGTGENDYWLQLDALKEFGRVGLFGSGGYVVRGSPGVLRLRNAPFGNLGVAYRFGEQAQVGASYFYREAAVSGDPALQEARLFVAFKASPRLYVRPYARVGFSNSSPGWGAGITLGWQAIAPVWEDL